jgi:hypothetical protein
VALWPRALALVILAGWVGEYVADAVLGTWAVEYDLPLQLTDAVSAAAVLALWNRRALLVELLYFWSLTASVQAVLTPDLGQSFPSKLEHRLPSLFGVLQPDEAVLPLASPKPLDRLRRRAEREHRRPEVQRLDPGIDLDDHAVQLAANESRVQDILGRTSHDATLPRHYHAPVESPLQGTQNQEGEHMGFMDRLKKGAESVQAQTSKFGVGASADQMALANRAQKLQKEGVDTPGHIDSMTATGNTDTPGGTEYSIDFTVSPPGGAPYQVTTNQYIRRRPSSSATTSS